MNKTHTLKNITKTNSEYKACLNLTTVSKQLYNVGLYALRQSLIHDNTFLSFKDVYKIMKENENWTLLPAKVSNQVFKQVTNSWSCWLNALEDYKNNPEKYHSKPNMPKYKQNQNIITYEKGALNTRGLKENTIKLSKSTIILNISSLPNTIKQVKIIPTLLGFKLIGLYEEEKVENKLDDEKIAGIDLGINNLIALATNQVNINHLLINGRSLKSINQFYNKKLAQLKSQLPDNIKTSNAIKRLTSKRNNKVLTFSHQASALVVRWLVSNRIGQLIIGKNKGWKDSINIGKKNNQSFVQIPHAKLIDLLTYKFRQQGGKVIVTEESYTSKASALDLDTMPVYSKKDNQSPVFSGIVFSGKRIKRGLYQTAKGLLINADINGALNIIRKVAKEFLDDLVESTQFIHYTMTPNKIEVGIKSKTIY